jgi:hypothetical protein
MRLRRGARWRFPDQERAMMSVSRFGRPPMRTGLRIVLASLSLGALSVLPLWLAMHWGVSESAATTPALIAMFGTIAGALGAFAGALWLALEILLRRH